MSIRKFIAVGVALLISAAANAGVVHYDVDAYGNSTAGGNGASATEGALAVTAGEALQFSTDPNQIWHGAFWWDGNYPVLSTNADGVQNSWFVALPGTWSTVGTLVADIGGDFRNIGAGSVMMNAWASGELRLWYADVNQFDNSGMVQTSVTTSDVPEPASLAIFGLGLAGLAAARRRNATK